VGWQEEYERKLTSPEEAVKLIKSGDYVSFTTGLEALDLGLALAARGGELKNIRLYVPTPGRNFPWYAPRWEGNFNVSMGHVMPVTRKMIEERRGDYLVSGLLWAEDPATPSDARGTRKDPSSLRWSRYPRMPLTLK